MKKIILTIIFCLIAVNSSEAATRLLKTVKPSGGDYTSLEACMNANEQNLVTADQYFDVEIDGDWTGAPDTTACTIHNYTVDATRKITIYAIGDAKHDGTAWKATAYVRTVGALSINIGAGGNYLTMKDFVIDCGAGPNQAISEATNLTTPLYKNLIIHNSTNSSATISIGNTSSSICENLILFNVNRGIFCGATNANAKAYNCTLYGAATSTYGILRIAAVNCYAGNFDTECFFALAAGSDYNVASDTSASDEATNYVDSKATYADYFVDMTGGAENFHLKGATSGAGIFGLAGTDLSATFTDDIDGTTRSGTWDIGADEYVAASTGFGQVIIISD
jgi:hypothetical protein